jgi:hypothetical protein
MKEWMDYVKGELTKCAEKLSGILREFLEMMGKEFAVSLKSKK